MFIYDTKSKQKVPFEPLVKNKANIYVCGLRCMMTLI